MPHSREWMRQQSQGTVVEAYRDGSITPEDWHWYVASWNANYESGRSFTRMSEAGTLYVPKEGA